MQANDGRKGMSAGHAKSDLLREMLDASRDDASHSDSVAGQRTRIRALVTEVTRVSPLKLSRTLTTIARSVASELCNRAADYTLRRIERRAQLSKNEWQAVEDEVTDAYRQFLAVLKDIITEEFVNVENLLLSHTFSLDPTLYAEGFIRFRHHEGIDYTDPVQAAELANAVAQAEASVEARLNEISRLRTEIAEIEAIAPEIGALDQWLQEAVPPDLTTSAAEIKGVASSLTRELTALRATLKETE